MITLHLFFTLVIFVPVWYLGDRALDHLVKHNETAHTLLNILLISGFVAGTEFFLSTSS